MIHFGNSVAEKCDSSQHRLAAASNQWLRAPTTRDRRRNACHSDHLITATASNVPAWRCRRELQGNCD